MCHTYANNVFHMSGVSLCESVLYCVGCNMLKVKSKAKNNFWRISAAKERSFICHFPSFIVVLKWIPHIWAM